MELSELEEKLSSLSLGSDEEAADPDAVALCCDVFTRDELSSDTLTRCAEQLATFCRNGDNRAVVADHPETLRHALQLLHDTDRSEELRTACACMVGNAVFQHEGNRALVAQEWRAADVVELIGREKSGDVLVNVGAAIDNVARGDGESFERDLVEAGAVDAISKLLRNKDVVVCAMAASTLGKIAGRSDECKKAMGEGAVMQCVTKHMLKPAAKERVVSAGIELLSALLSEAAGSLTHFISIDGLEQLITVSMASDSERNREEACTVLSGLLSLPDMHVTLMERGIVRDLLRECTSSKPHVQQAALRFLGYAAVHEPCVPQIFKLYKNFVRYLSDPETNVRLYSTMILSNIARSDESCRKLLSEGVCSKLVHLLRTEDNTQFHHLCAGTLRNLAIPRANKGRVGSQEGVFPALLARIEPTGNPFTVFSSVMAIKVLCTETPENLERFMEHNGLKTLIDLINGDVPEERKKIVYEAARMLCQNAGASAAFRARMVSEGGMAAVNLLLASPFPLLQQEGFGVLLRMKGDGVDVGNAVATGNTALPLVLMSASGDSNLRVLSLKFLVELAESGAAVRDALRVDNMAHQYLDPVAAGTSPSSPMAKRLLDLVDAEEAQR